ncbi:DUF2264 domain-containing protein [Pseudarthrobacter sp. BIM B-2242]|uniref:DUF2264 domain-containing protein n=1 Tax=Pseudarthrobacter sp. BIM B-2242 TaxID=2772401 RepID=UPI00168A89D6|nr:DUF2264 domain-containing protein [Pseudarthrobacter sp. BIM B-2242]QOD02632.1 DUF2264 domain-containing protein [Pseudarthrobacter sp. BIM B-2242]
MDKQSALDLADVLLSAVIDRASTDGSIHLPGKASKWGTASDGYEGVSRPLLLASFRLAGSPGLPEWHDRLLDVIELGASNRGGWPEADKLAQALVETASLALSLRIAPSRLFEPLSQGAKNSLIERFRRSLDVTPSENNWVMFPHVIADFLESIGLSDEKTRRAIANSRKYTESWYRGGGLYTDGSGRTFDYYNAWAFHFYLPLISHLGRDQSALELYGARLDEYWRFARNLVESSGAPVFFGRSLTYRFAIAAPFAVSALISPAVRDDGERGRIWSAVIEYFMSRGAVTGGLLSVGWHGEYREMAQRYTGPASPYWASKAFAALLIPNQSEFWKQDAPEAEARSEHAVSGVGLLATTRAKVAILHNHGSDHQKARVTAFFKDDPLYTRRSYSSRTVPIEISGMPDNSFGILQKGRLSGRGVVKVVTTSRDYAASIIEPTVTRFLFSSNLLNFGKFDRIGPRVLAAGGVSIVEYTILDGKWDIQIFCLSKEKPGLHFRLTSWALPSESVAYEYTVDSDSDIPSARWRNATTGAELIGLHGFRQASLVAGDVTSPLGPSAVMGLLDNASCEVNVFIAASRLYDIADDNNNEMRPSVNQSDTDISISCTDGRIIRIPKVAGGKPEI